MNRSLNHRLMRSSAARGFGLVELMVALVIGLVASLAIFQTFAANEQSKRTTTSGSEGLQTALFALDFLESTLINSGYGILGVSDPSYQSVTRNVNMAGNDFTLSSVSAPIPELHIGCTSAGVQAGLRIAPLMVTGGAGGLASDTLTIMAGSAAAVPLPVQAVPTAVAAGVSNIILKTTYGFNVGDWVLVYEQNDKLPAQQGMARPTACTLARVTGLPLAPVVNTASLTLDTPTAAAYSIASVFNLGPNPSFMQLTVDANARLIATDLLNPAAPIQVLADHVVSMKLQLGVDQGGDDVIDAWINPPAAAATWTTPPNPLPNLQISALPIAVAAPALHRVKSLRVGLLVRSPQFERADAAGNCTISGSGPFEILPAATGNNAQRLPDMPSAGTYNLAGDQRCFRYNTVTTTVALRNILLSEM